jgi:DNA-binding HxlR family transcriptional regulator
VDQTRDITSVTKTAQDRAFEIPIKPDLGLLGRRWTARILADIGFREVNRFSMLIRANPGLTRRLLSKRLRDLESEGLIQRRPVRGRPKVFKWFLAPKGRELLPVLMEIMAFGSKWNNSYRFQGRLPSLAKEENP